MHPRALADWLQKAANLFMDGDIEVRCIVLELLASYQGLRLIGSCLSSTFLAQRWSAVINFPDHVVPLLKILPDPIIRTHPQTKAYAMAVYAVVMDVSHRAFWAKVMTMFDEAVRMNPFFIGPQMSGQVMIFMNSIEFDSKNLENPIIKDALPRFRAHLEAFKARKYGGDLSPSMAASFEVLEGMFKQKPRLQSSLMAGERPAAPQIEETSGQLRALQISRQAEMQQYLEKIDARFVRSDLVEDTGVIEDGSNGQHENAAAQDYGFECIPEADVAPGWELEQQADSEARQADFESRKTDFKSRPAFGEEIQAMDPYGLFHKKASEDESESMVFKHQLGDTLFKQWLERAGDPDELNLEWGKSADIKSMKVFLQVTLTLFNCATTETRLKFLSSYYLKQPYVAKFWDCLKVELPTDAINYPTPKYSDHVSATMHIMSHDDVARRAEFKAVRTQMSKMMASQPGFLYGIQGYLKTHFRNKCLSQEMLATAMKNIVVVIEGVFKLVDGSRIPLEFRHEAKAFLELAWEIESRKLPSERTAALTLEAVGRYIDDHAKKFPLPKGFKGCHARQEVEAKKTSTQDPTTVDLGKQLLALAQKNMLVRPLAEYLGQSKRQDDGDENRKGEVSVAQRFSLAVQGKVQEAKQEHEEESAPLNNEEALQYLADCKSVGGLVAGGVSAQGVREGSTVKFQLPQKVKKTGGAADAVETGQEGGVVYDTPYRGLGTTDIGRPPKDQVTGKGIVLGPRPKDRLTEEYYAQGRKPAAQEQQPETAQPPATTPSRLVQGRRLRLGRPAEASPSLPAMASASAGKNELPVHQKPATTVAGGVELPAARAPSLPASQRMVKPPTRAFEATGTLACGHRRYLQYDETNCPEPVKKVTPVCGHIALVECSNKMRHWRCKAKCDAPLGCGHRCGHLCIECLEEVKADGSGVWKHLPCRTCSSILYLQKKEQEKAEKAAGGRGGGA
ncbi:hypothetical protein ABW21_db0202358 [Orbilia brochopaga]|nr:hypothetical protein ABW21_db0202358 [Drechslerella brochopaga]